MPVLAAASPAASWQTSISASSTPERLLVPVEKSKMIIALVAMITVFSRQIRIGDY
ncbi:hypothetical protein [Plasticicumulans sp.]|uniref:hypothetical protein n=1 Tax=Plasticicumulans sp. TaxID=2307179 RepID=UPI002B5B4E4B|nr:hypothetical protein [Plasticicumulans sp.]HNM42357.1 hypothetical protein [Plasticicumulans sp.]